ncbi:unnamed protein product [Caenorhabditis angaria]|uniref:Uncharacterized protein n=1 Tax=Caenorhabditis angaria TaxID=860376 RepID=A0A9P1IL35_9PELO|nr:unnamed protein product [Caenorhabditis angaria]
MPSWGDKVKEVEEDIRRERRRHEERLDDSRRDHNSDARRLRDRIERLDKELAAEERLEYSRDTNGKEIKVRLEQSENEERKRKEYAEEVNDVRKSLNAQKEKQVESQIKEKTQFMQNQLENTLAAQKSLTTFDITSRQQIASDKQRLDALGNNLAEETRNLADLSIKNRDEQFEKILQLERENYEAVEKKKELDAMFLNRAKMLEQEKIVGRTELYKASQFDEDRNAQRNDLLTVRRKFSAMKGKVDEFCLKFDMPIEMKDENGFRRAVHLATLYVKNLEKQIQGIDENLQKLQEEKAMKSTTIINLILSVINDIFETEKKTITIGTSTNIMGYLNKLNEETRRLGEIIELIPEIPESSDFANALESSNHMIGRFDPKNAIESSSQHIRQIQ